MYRRLAAVSRDLEWLGMSHQSEYEKMLMRLAGNGPVAPVRTLAAVVEPVKDYAREAAHPYDRFAPMNRLIDAARPDSETTRTFAALVDRLPADPSVLPQIREFLTLWRDNDARLQPVIANSALLAETAGLSRDLSALAAAGLAALDHQAVPDRPIKPTAELIITVEPAIRKLIARTR